MYAGPQPGHQHKTVDTHGIKFPLPHSRIHHCFLRTVFKHSPLLGLHPPQRRAAVIMFGRASCSHHPSKLHLNAALQRTRSFCLPTWFSCKQSDDPRTDAACPPDISLIDGTEVFKWMSGLSFRQSHGILAKETKGNNIRNPLEEKWGKMPLL